MGNAIRESRIVIFGAFAILSRRRYNRRIGADIGLLTNLMLTWLRKAMLHLKPLRGGTKNREKRGAWQCSQAVIDPMTPGGYA